MNLNDFPELHKQCGSFGVYKNTGYWTDRCLIKVVCPADHTDIIPVVVRKIVDLQLALNAGKPGGIFQVQYFEASLPGVKHKVTNITGIVEKSAGEAAMWLEANNVLDIQIPSPVESFDTSKLSVGPCAYENADGRFVKVRFDGVSIPFYIVNGKWDSAKTTVALTKQSGPDLANKFVSILAAHESVVLDRAKERKLNKSGLPEYAVHKITYWIELPDKIFQSVQADSPYMSKPESKIYPVCSYGYQWRSRKLNDYIMYDNVLYNITGYHMKKEEWKVAPHYQNNYQGVPLDYKLEDFDPQLFSSTPEKYIYRSQTPHFFTLTNMKAVDADDTFVHEKVLRTLKARL